MSALPEFHLYTADAALARRIAALAAAVGAVRHHDTPRQLLGALGADSSALVLIDLCSADAATLVATLHVQHPELPIIALGEARSDPAMAAERQGVYAVEDPDPERKRFQNLLQRALDHLALRDENRALREALHRAPSVLHISQAISLLQKPSSMHNLSHFTRAFRHFGNGPAFLADAVEGVATCLSVARAGVFMLDDTTGRYRLHAGRKCLEGTETIEFEADSPLTVYLEGCSSLASIETLETVTAVETRRLLRRTLEVLGAELLVPLHARGRLLGWLFLGQRISGQAFGAPDLENLMVVAEFVTAIWTNAVRQDEAVAQRNLLDAMIHAIGLGVVAVGPDGVVRCINEPALALLRRPAKQVLGRGSDSLGSLAPLLQDVLDQPDQAPRRAAWLPPGGDRELQVYTQRLGHDGGCVGAFALIQQATGATEVLPDQLGGGAPLRTLSRDLSHEIKNQLVAINTFIQLLPERYDDPEFRTRFCELAIGEIARIKELLSDDCRQTPAAN